MGQTSNILTLRNYKKNLNFLSTSDNIKYFLFGFKFLIRLEQLFNKKGILIINHSLNFINNQYFLYLNLFFRFNKIIKYTKKILKNKKKFLINNKINKLFIQNFNFLKVNLVSFRIKVSNLEINKNLISKLFFKLNKFNFIIFAKRFGVFIDFLKISCLLYKDKMSAKSFLYILGQIFRFLPKKKHVKFFLLIKTLFTFLVLNKKKQYFNKYFRVKINY